VTGMNNTAHHSPRRRPDSASAQVARLLSMLPYLRAHPYARVSDVAKLFAVSERQVIRDLRVLWFSGLPGLAMGDYIEVDMEAVEGEGVISVSNADYLARPLRLRTDEAVALLVALRTLAAMPGSFERDAIDRAIPKI
jgi:proteasome accessory factor C